MMKWMNCTTCKRVVIANETGICLNCQGGFSKGLGPDDYFMQAGAKPEQSISELRGEIDAIKERIKQENNQQEHQGRNGGGEATTPSRSNRPPNCS